MVDARDLLLFGLAAFVMVLSPGPNMVYLVSRSICQGRNAAILSLFGVAVGFLFHMLLAALGLTVVFVTIPIAYNALKLAGAAYLLWLAWQAVRPNAPAMFEAKNLPPDSKFKLFFMGLFTNMLNPKIAVFYISIFTQFLHPERGSVLTQSIILGSTQIAISFAVNFVIILTAGAVSSWFTRHPLWIRVQKWFMGAVLAGLAVKLASSKQP
ncbi:LysE family translocator [Pendulispora albinea]|uniref:LysE family translocator n=1 Tax=Pendulispora albinea TaxID=2741071 RepID=A0ABZ2M6J4_9BACT